MLDVVLRDIAELGRVYVADIDRVDTLGLSVYLYLCTVLEKIIRAFCHGKTQIPLASDYPLGGNAVSIPERARRGRFVTMLDM